MVRQETDANPVFFFKGTIVHFGNKCKYDFLTRFLDVVLLVKYSELFGMSVCLYYDDGSRGRWI